MITHIAELLSMHKSVAVTKSEYCSVLASVVDEFAKINDTPTFPYIWHVRDNAYQFTVWLRQQLYLPAEGEIKVLVIHNIGELIERLLPHDIETLSALLIELQRTEHWRLLIYTDKNLTSLGLSVDAIAYIYLF